MSVFLTNLRRETLRREQATVRAVTDGRLLTWAELFTELGEIGRPRRVAAPHGGRAAQ